MSAARETKQERTRKKELAQFFYCNSQLSQKEIAEKVGVSEVSMSKWVREGKWDTLKASITITRQEQLNRVYQQISAINNKITEEQKGIPTGADADVLAKLAAVVERLLTWKRSLYQGCDTQLCPSLKQSLYAKENTLH